MTKSLKTETVNKLALAAYLRTVPDEKFDMLDWFIKGNLMIAYTEDAKCFLSECGTTACVGGHAAVFFGIPTDKKNWMDQVPCRLGIDEQKHAELFFNSGATRQNQIDLLERWAREEANANPE